LTGNAIKFTAKGEVVVRASLVSESDGDCVVRFSVRDTGIGIPAAKHDMLFEKFTQADASTTRRFGGTGLGLAISKQLAVMMGGQIGLISEDGHGAEFWFTVRFAKPREPRRELPVPVAVRGVRVLVVDDNETNREVMRLQLASWDARTETAANGAQGLQALYEARDSGSPFRVALIDMQMPGMDGVSMVRAIKNDDTLEDTRLVLFSSMGQRGDARRMQDLGVDGYLTKPARHADVLGCLSAVLSGTTHGQEPHPVVTRHVVREMRPGPVRILLVEDNITNQEVAVALLNKFGYRVDTAVNGREAVAALGLASYDLVLMDVLMPEMDGLEATRTIRHPESTVLNRRIPIIAMTANAMQGDREQCLRAGMDDYVSKPVSWPALEAALNKWLPPREC
jgi:CheY-like chemotaxis protein